MVAMLGVVGWVGAWHTCCCSFFDNSKIPDLVIRWEAKMYYVSTRLSKIDDSAV